MNIDRLIEISHEVVTQPWGLGHPAMNNAEAAAPYYRFLHHVVAEFGIRLAVECGTYLGYGAAHMAMASDKVTVVTFDINPQPDSRLLLNQFPNAYLMLTDSTGPLATRIVEAMTVRSGKIGLLFLDSEHDGATPTEELLNFLEHFADECLVCCDDILDERMAGFWAMMPGEKVELHHLHPAQYDGYPNPGFGISLVKARLT